MASTISLASGKEVEVKPSPDEIVDTIEQAEGELIRVIDIDDYAVWLNPDYIVSITSHDVARASA